MNATVSSQSEAFLHRKFMQFPLINSSSLQAHNQNELIMFQLDVEMKKVERLNEELISVKSRYGDLISRLRSLCSSIQLNGGQCEVPSKDEDMVVVIDDLILKALTTAKREADTLRIQQHAQIAELTDLRNDIEKLRLFLVISHAYLHVQQQGGASKVLQIYG
ncbi:unnamed protein product [Anisakis simplex]|uniref:Uncharacterized protein n=1 Tax=Anisakis simplex TaxID=6269 RepID=A0A0M3JNX8_ANISI|nr:unnamed protein product [Anisakis simplex]